MISAGEFRNGVTFEQDGQVLQVVEFQHLTVVSGQGVIHVEHEGFDAVCREKIRVDALDGFEDVFRG